MRCDDAVIQLPERVLGWKRLRFSDIETGTRDPTLRQGLDKIIGPHEPASGNVDQPGVVLHGSKLSFRHHAFGLASQWCGKDEQIGVYQSPSEGLERYGFDLRLASVQLVGERRWL